MKKKPIIMDCDPGHDDAIAILLALASDKLDVKAITTVAGNQTVEKTFNNALRVLSFVDKYVPVAKGASEPLIRNLETAPEVHGESGLEGPELPEPTIEPSELSAIDLMVDVIMNSEEKITIVPTAALTNVATLFLTHPEVKDKIEEISLMGGACDGGNWTPSAEFNILVDPEAADIVFRSGVPITMCGLDVTHKAQIYKDEIEVIRGLGNKTSVMVAELLDFFAIFHKNEDFGFEGPPLHDPCAVAYLIDPTIFTTRKHFVEIETKGELTLGATVVDVRDMSGKEKNVNVVFDVDREKLFEMLCDAFKTFNN